MKKNTFRAFVLFSIILNVVFVSVWGFHVFQRYTARKQPAYTGMMVCNRVCPLHRTIGVNDRQWHRIQPFLKVFLDSSKSIDDSIEVFRSQLIEALASDTIDTVLIKNVQAKILQKQNLLQDLVINHILAERTILTKEQRNHLFLLLRADGFCGQGPRFGRNAFRNR